MADKDRPERPGAAERELLHTMDTMSVDQSKAVEELLEYMDAMELYVVDLYEDLDVEEKMAQHFKDEAAALRHEVVHLNTKLAAIQMILR